MKYVKDFDILGVKTAQIPCIELQGVPNTATKGVVGLLGIDITSPKYELYKCVKVEGNIYTWLLVSVGGNGDCKLPDVTNNDNGKFLTVVNGEWVATEIPNAEEVSV